MIATINETNFYLAYAGESIAWSPEGKRIAFISAVDEVDSVDDANIRRDPRVIDRIQYKSRTSFSDNLKTHLFVVDVDDERTEPRQLTEGKFYDHAISWSPRGDEIAFLSNHELDPDANNNSDIFAVTTNGRIRQITTTNGCEYEPRWSPDGKWIAYTATSRDVTTIDSIAEDTHVWVIDAQGGRGRDLTSSQDRRAHSPRWSTDSQDILFLAGDNGQSTIFRVGIRGGNIEVFDIFLQGGFPKGTFRRGPVISNRRRELPATDVRRFQISSFSLAANVRDTSESRTSDVSGHNLTLMAFTLGDTVTPAEVWFAPASLHLLHRRSSHNDDLLRSVSVVEPEEISFKSFDGAPIQAWLIKPANWQEGQRYPVDPKHSWRAAWNVRVQFQSDLSGLRSAWIRGVVHEPARIKWVRAKIFRRDIARMGRWRLQRFDDRC